MKMQIVLPAMVGSILLVHPASAMAANSDSTRSVAPAEFLLAQRARTCKQVRSCREAVEIWCGGYTRADADHDGIPCENICHSKSEVDELREEIDC